MSEIKVGTIGNLHGSYGFVSCDEQHFFFHAGMIETPLTIADLHVGDSVTFFEEAHERGTRARNVARLA